MLDKTGIDLDWWAWIFIAIAVIGLLGWLRIDLNAKVLAIFLTAEVVVLAFFDLVVLADPGPEGFALTGFDPSVTFGAALGAGLVFTMAAFTGFESAAIYSEECKEPRKTVAKATYIALGITSLFYAFSALMLGNAVGPQTIIDPEALVAGGFVGVGWRPRPDDGPLHHPRRRRSPRRSPTSRCCCSAPASSRRCSPSTTPSPDTVSRSAGRR